MSSRSLPTALVPLRGFLGVAFTYAGIQKLANPDFFRASSPISIQQSLVLAVKTSPVGALVRPLLHVGLAVGVAMAVTELAVGLAVLLGAWVRPAAVVGLLISFSLFLTVSFHTSPWFTGADIVYVFAWSALILGPPTPWSLANRGR
jgi:thiosulfate dehydrogenase [quinone] large subunit